MGVLFAITLPLASVMVVASVVPGTPEQAGIGLKTATTDLAASMVTMQVAEGPVQAPCHEEKVLPAAATAVSWTEVPALKGAEHEGPAQFERPGDELRRFPLPWTDMASGNPAGSLPLLSPPLQALCMRARVITKIRWRVLVMVSSGGGRAWGQSGRDCTTVNLPFRRRNGVSRNR